MCMSPQSLLVAQELHEDGNTHYHVYISFSVKKNVKKQEYFDVDGFHCNVQAARSAWGVIEYCTKNGGPHRAYNIDVEAMLLSRGSHKRQMYSLVLEVPLHVAVATYPELIQGYKRLKADL